MNDATDYALYWPRREILGTKDGEYAYQWATVQLVEDAVPLVLDAGPIQKGESRREIVGDLIDTAQKLIHVDRVLMDREFDSQHILKELDQRGLGYVVPKRMQTRERVQAKRLAMGTNAASEVVYHAWR